MKQFLFMRDDSGRNRILETLLALDMSDPWKVTIEPSRMNRSLEQNNLYHKWIGIIAQDTGNSHHAMHEWCKDEFLPPVMIEFNGRTKKLPASTTKLKIDEMSNYMTQVQAWAAYELGIILPVPEDRR